MFNFYLYNKSYEKANAAQIEENLKVLNDLVIAERANEDFFWKNDSIWSCNTKEGNFSDVVFSKIHDRQLSQQVIPRLLQTIPSIPEEFSSIDEFIGSSYKIYNAFYGAVFDDPSLINYVTDRKTYSAYKNKYLYEITPKTLWERKEILFSNLILCPDVESNLKTVGAKYLHQILNRLLELDKYAATKWLNGDFDYCAANKQTSLRISPESKETMKQEKYRNMRMFKMPDGTNKCFDLHIKTGDFRFYFHPENRKVYIGYIGSHLPTIRY